MKRRTLIYIIALISVLALVIAGMLALLYCDFTPRPVNDALTHMPDTVQLENTAAEQNTVAQAGTDAEQNTAAQPESGNVQQIVSEKVAEEGAETQQKVAETQQTAPEIKVPEGPWEVKNAATGKMCLFGQKEDGSLYMEQNGKTLWSKPFKDGSLCGNVVAVDYYNNGKLQYAFASGSKIYLYDRLGRDVKGFPTELGKDILLGPAVYDFNGVKRYNILVLHKDNSIQMYNFKGVRPEKWKGITSEAKILSLPELVTEGKDSYWLVSTASGVEKWPFYGGEKLK